MRDSSLEALADTLEFTKAELIQECSSREGPSLGTLGKIADHFEITIDDLLDGRIDQEWVRSPKLAERFTAENGSRMRTSIAVLRWLENEYGEATSKNLMRALRIPEDVLRSPEKPVKLQLLAKLLQAASARGLSGATLFEIGTGAMSIPENADIRSRIQQIHHPRQVLDYFFSEMTEKLESNYDYTPLRLTANQIDLKITPKENRILENGLETITDRGLTTYRCGVTASVLRSVGIHSARAKILHPSSGENPTEIVRLTWENDHATFKGPRRLRLVETSSREL